MRHQSGQALVLALLLSASLVGALMLVFNAGQVVNAKQRLVSAADAVAYSAAVFEARSLNYQAYLNRAVVANEAAIAQAVSLRSWSGYMNISLRNINRVGQFIPYVGQVTRALSRIWAGIDQELQPSLALAEGAISQLDHAFAGAAQAMHAATLTQIEPLASDIARLNDGATVLTRGGQTLIANNLRSFASLTRRYEGRARARQADLVLRSRDRFTRNRPWGPGPQSGASFVRLPKRGGTDLITLDQWRGMDTFALHVRGFTGWREQTSIGWGGGENGARSARRGEHGGSWRANPRTSRRAQSETRRSSGYRGIPALRDVVPRRGTEPELQVAVELGRDLRRVSLWSNVLPDSTAVVPASAPAAASSARLSFAAPDSVRSMRAFSEARVFFDRPTGRADRRRELGSLFNPYWRAQLAPVSRRSRVIAAGANGTPDPFGMVAQ
jgi:Putative Flp pilus-assembly TadE/G-like